MPLWPRISGSLKRLLIWVLILAAWETVYRATAFDAKTNPRGWKSWVFPAPSHIADSLLAETRRLAHRDGVTLRALIERGLRRVIAESKEAVPFKLRRASFKGGGLQAEFAEATWDRLRDAIYRDRGA